VTPGGKTNLTAAIVLEVLSINAEKTCRMLKKNAVFNIQRDGILHSHRRENLKSYIALTGWIL
jgi:hypothetical protein